MGRNQRFERRQGSLSFVFVLFFVFHPSFFFLLKTKGKTKLVVDKITEIYVYLALLPLNW
jgi:hypothetical protein